MSAARSVTTWTSSEAYRTRGGPAATPSLRTSQEAFTSRATFSATKFAIAPPETKRPPAAAGSPNISANQRRRASSTSVAAGESRHPPTFMLTPDASMSATAPGTVPAPLM